MYVTYKITSRSDCQSELSSISCNCRVPGLLAGKLTSSSPDSFTFSLICHNIPNHHIVCTYLIPSIRCLRSLRFAFQLVCRWTSPILDIPFHPLPIRIFTSILLQNSDVWQDHMLRSDQVLNSNRGFLRREFIFCATLDTGINRVLVIRCTE